MKYFDIKNIKLFDFFKIIEIFFIKKLNFYEIFLDIFYLDIIIHLA